MTWQLFCFGFFAGSAYATITIYTIQRRRDRKPKISRKLARDCGTCRHVIYAEHCDCPEGSQP
jgi:hypothetical protein